MVCVWTVIDLSISLDQIHLSNTWISVGKSLYRVEPIGIYLGKKHIDGFLGEHR